MTAAPPGPSTCFARCTIRCRSLLSAAGSCSLRAHSHPPPRMTSDPPLCVPLGLQQVRASPRRQPLANMQLPPRVHRCAKLGQQVEFHIGPMARGKILPSFSPIRVRETSKEILHTVQRTAGSWHRKPPLGNNVHCASSWCKSPNHIYAVRLLYAGSSWSIWGIRPVTCHPAQKSAPLLPSAHLALSPWYHRGLLRFPCTSSTVPLALLLLCCSKPMHGLLNGALYRIPSPWLPVSVYN